MFSRISIDAVVFWGVMALAGIAVALTSGCVTTCDKNHQCVSWPV